MCYGRRSTTNTLSWSWYAAREPWAEDTGLGRLGFLPDDVPVIRETLGALDWVEVESIASHQATPVQPEHDPFTMRQYEQFAVVCESLDPDHRWLRHFSSSNAVPRLPEVNADAVPRLPEVNADAVRCQALSWGYVHYLPVPWPLRPVASHKARLVQVKDLPAGHNVGRPRFVEVGTAGAVHMPS